MKTHPVLIERHGDVEQLGRADESTSAAGDGDVLARSSFPLVDQEISLVVVVVSFSIVTWGRIFRVICRDGWYKNTYKASTSVVQLDNNTAVNWSNG